MNHYAYCGFEIRSTVPLPELGAIDGRAVTGGWECGPGAVAAADPRRAVHTWMDAAGSAWVRIAAVDAGFLLEFVLGARFQVTGDRVTWDAPHLPPNTIRHLLLDQVLPLAISTRHALAIHASSVATGTGAVAFVGASGQGKSTLAAAFAASGYPIIGDDCAVLRETGGGWSAAPAYPGVRLWPDTAAVLGVHADDAVGVAHYSAKVRVATAPATAPVAVRRLYLLSWTDASDSRVALAGASAAIDLIRCVFRMDLHDRAALARDFEAACRLVGQRVVRRLYVPRSLAGVDAVVETVLADCARDTCEAYA